jgi:hypothetical protein
MRTPGPLYYCALLLPLAPISLGAQSSIPRVTRVGSAKAFGPGILYANARELRFELSRSAEVIVLQLDPTGGISPMFPTDSEPGLRPAGVHVLAAPLPDEVTSSEELRLTPRMQTAQELARAGRSVRPPAAALPDTAAVVAYWLVIVSDAPTTGPEVRAQLESMPLEYNSVEAELRALPAALVGKRTKNWGAFYTTVY